jgi:hypothetical protein
MKIVECLFEVVKQILMFFRLHHYIINVGFDVPPNLVFQNDVHAFLIRSPPPPIIQPEGHLSVAKNSE